MSTDASRAADEAGVPSGRAVRGRPARYTQADLVEVVARVFNERGYEAASMEDLARASGLTKSTFYHHVSGKEQLLRLAVNRALDALSAVMDEDEQDVRPPVDRLEHVLRRTTEVLLAELPYVTLLLRLRGNTEIEREAISRRRAFDARLASLVQAAADASEIRSDIDPRLVTRLLFGMVNSITEWYRPDSRAGDARATSDDGIVHAVVEMALTGLQARREQEVFGSSTPAADSQR